MALHLNELGPPLTAAMEMCLPQGSKWQAPSTTPCSKSALRTYAVRDRNDTRAHASVQGSDNTLSPEKSTGNSLTSQKTYPQL